jgi:selenocysteine lyase/cysteine desulfurase
MLTLTNLPRSNDVVPRDFGELRHREFSRLDASGEAYLDHTGCALYAESHVRAHAAHLSGALLGNPHSESPASLRSTADLEAARALTLRFLDADPDAYTVIFTPNATGAIRLVAEAFPFRAGSRFVLSADNHNSVNGIREYAVRRGASVQVIPLDVDLRLRDPQAYLPDARESPALFAYPAQSNFSGVQHPLWLIDVARSRGYSVLLDAAAFVPTARLSLRDVAPDFVALSFYKIFGYPTGLGALVGRREALARLERPWFSGGTIEFASVQGNTHLLKAGAEGFEDGTPNYLAASALPFGFGLLDSLGIDRIGRHVTRLTGRLLEGLLALRHACGRSMVVIHGPTDGCARGGTVAFNILDRDGRVVPYTNVEAAARDRNVSVRGGCFCNPGASEHAFGFVAAEARACLDRLRRDGFSIPRFAECMRGVPVGAVRASFGAPSNDRDVERLLELVAEWKDRR